MPFSFSELREKAKTSLHGTKIVTLIFDNPFYTAILTVLAILFIVMFVFRDFDIEKRDYVKFIVYTLLAVTCIQFIHINYMKKTFDNEGNSKLTDDIFKESERVRFGGVNKDNLAMPANSITYGKLPADMPGQVDRHAAMPVHDTSDLDSDPDVKAILKEAGIEDVGSTKKPAGINIVINGK